ncbi:MAG: monooxygenase, FAD-binding:FAD dependent oxidoreductase, partial [Microbacteriaceae bacterium]|nr:monooxygenase, FAD-binding:FAD dependent oxidoreductase [Microbacteriaceae bacterium]
YGEWHRRREIAESGCLLVRPDGYIAWRMSEALDSASEAEAQLLAAIESIMGKALR